MTNKSRNSRSPFAATRLLLLAGLFLCTGAFAQNVDDGFSADANNDVVALVVQDDGKIIVGGYFNTIAGQARQRLARLNADGSIDTSFAVPAISDGVRFAFLQPDGRIIIAGFFSQVGGVPRDRIARLNADGSLDPSYNPSVGNSTSVMIFSMAMQADGKLVAGGNFDTFGGVARDNIARLNSDGTLDESFAPVVNNQIAAVATQADGKLFISGLFTSIDNVARNYAARLHTDGSVDSTYVPSQWPSSTDGLAIQPDGKMLAAGYNFILRMNADDGLRDQSFPNLTTNN